MNIYITKYSILIGPYTFILVEFCEKMWFMKNLLRALFYKSVYFFP